MGFRGNGSTFTLPGSGGPGFASRRGLEDDGRFVTSYSATFCPGRAPKPGQTRPVQQGVLGMAAKSTLSQPTAMALAIPSGMSGRRSLGKTFRTEANANLQSSLPGTFRGGDMMAMRSSTSTPQLTSAGSSPPTTSHRHGSKQRNMRRLALELLVDPELEKKAKEIFASHAHGKNSLQFSDYLTMLHSLHNKFGLPQPNAKSAKRIFHRFNRESNLSFDDFFDLLKALLRRNAFDHSTTLSREFFINKRSDGDKIWTVYDKIRQLGEGSFGTAHLVKRKDNSEERVVKVVAKARSSLPVEEIEQEILILRQVDHPHVVRLFEWYEDASSIYLVIEALKGGTLQEVMLLQQKRKQGLHENWTRKVVRQVADAMCYCHGLRLIHKDLKDENIMLLRRDPNFEDPFAVVIDLGVAEMFSLADPAGREIGGSPTTMAPEVWSGTFGPKCDVWSLGCIFFELLSGSLPFLANSIQPSVWLRLAKRGPNWGLVKTCPQGKALCKSMLAYAVNERMTMEAVARHDYFKLALPELKAVPSEQFHSFATFCEQTKMKRALLLEMSARMPISKSQEIIKLFESLDKDRSGTIGESELQALFHKMGVDDEDLASRTFQALDADSDGSLTFSEFASGALLLFKDSLEENFRSLFLDHDRDRNGYLEVEEARQFLRDVAVAMSPTGEGEGVEDSLLEEVLASGDGHKIKYEQLRDVVLPQRTA